MPVSEHNPVRWNCPCGVTYRIGEETTVYSYNCQPWFDHIVVNCPQCHHAYRGWIGSEACLAIMTGFAANDEPTFEVTDFAPDAVVHYYALDRHLQAIYLDYVPAQRSPHQASAIDKQVAFMGWLLAHQEGEINA